MIFSLISHRSSLSKKLLLLAEYSSIASGFCIFLILLKNMKSAEFAEWEWLQVWLGLCLLLPRNGLDLVAIRSAYRQPALLREWSAIVIFVRLIISIPAFFIFWTGANVIGINETQCIVTLGLTLPLSASMPDIGARAQARFSRVSLILMLRNLIFLVMLLLRSNFNMTSVATLFLFCESLIWSAWWMDSRQNSIMPGGRWITLLYHGRNAILYRSLQQSLSRWLRVASYSIDAILLGLIMPDIWATMAPARRILLSVTIPFGNWLGSISHQMTTWPEEKMRQADTKAKMSFILLTLFTILIAEVHSPTKFLSCNTKILLLSLARFGGIAYGFWLVSVLTAQRNDNKSMIVPAIFCMNCLVYCIMAQFIQQITNLIIGMILLDWISILMARNYIWQRKHETVKKQLSTAPALRVKQLNIRRRADLESARSHA